MKKLFSIYAWFYLFLNIIVILGGALVRATGSGAGCGEYWPLCHGTVLPNLTVLNTLIEFMHRVSSGVVGIGAVILIIGAFFLYPKKHIMRSAAIAVAIFVLIEALLGAALVLFGLVENNASISRIFVMCLHLLNTFLLLGAITLTAAWSGRSFVPDKNIFSHHKKQRGFILFCLFMLLVTGVTGAITALSDTIFKPEYVGQDFFKHLLNPTNVLQNLRAIHPVIAIVTSLILGVTVSKFGFKKENAKLTYAILALIFIQVFIGMFNLVLLTPIVLQILHLLFADFLWILTILFLL